MALDYDRDPYEDDYERCGKCGCAIVPHRRYFAIGGKARPFYEWYCSGCGTDAHDGSRIENEEAGE